MTSPASFRCAAASEDRAESMTGTASPLRGVLLVEQPGPWGVDALRDARLPAGLGAALKDRAAETRTKVLLIRRPGRAVPMTDGVRVFAAHLHHARPWTETGLLGDLAAVGDLDLAAMAAGRSLGLARHERPVLAVCTHGRHDTCCAERGRPVAAALSAVFPEETWEVSHLGGDRFAASMLTLPHGLSYGRLDAESARRVARLLVAGEVDLDHLRGRAALNGPLQAAECALRRHVDEHRVDAVAFVSRTVEGARTDAVFDVDGRRYAVRVESTPSTDLQRLTCRAERDHRAMRHRVDAITFLA